MLGTLYVLSLFSIYLQEFLSKIFCFTITILSDFIHQLITIVDFFHIVPKSGHTVQMIAVTFLNTIRVVANS